MVMMRDPRTRRFVASKEHTMSYKWYKEVQPGLIKKYHELKDSLNPAEAFEARKIANKVIMANIRTAMHDASPTLRKFQYRYGNSFWGIVFEEMDTLLQTLNQSENTSSLVGWCNRYLGKRLAARLLCDSRTIRLSHISSQKSGEVWTLYSQGHSLNEIKEKTGMWMSTIVCILNTCTMDGSKDPYESAKAPIGFADESGRSSGADIETLSTLLEKLKEEALRVVPFKDAAETFCIRHTVKEDGTIPTMPEIKEIQGLASTQVVDARIKRVKDILKRECPELMEEIKSVLWR